MSDPADLKRARRIVIVSRTNGLSSATIAAMTLAASLFARDPIAVLASLGVCAGAALEIVGSFRASRRDLLASRFLVASQAVALTSILALVFRCTVAVSPATILGWLPASTRESILMIYPEPGEADQYLRTSVRIALASVALVAALFESGMAAYYSTSAGVFRRLAASNDSR